MTHETRVELTRQLEKMKLANEGANARWLFIAGIVAEILAVAAFFGASIRFFIQSEKEPGLYPWIAFAFILFAVVLLGHAIRLASNRFMNRRLRPLYEAVLEVPDTR